MLDTETIQLDDTQHMLSINDPVELPPLTKFRVTVILLVALMAGTIFGTVYRSVTAKPSITNVPVITVTTPAVTTLSIIPEPTHQRVRPSAHASTPKTEPTPVMTPQVPIAVPTHKPKKTSTLAPTPKPSVSPSPTTTPTSSPPKPIITHTPVPSTLVPTF